MKQRVRTCGLAAGLLAILSFGSAIAQGTLRTITFEGNIGPTDGILIRSLTEQGMRFTSIVPNGQFVWSGGRPTDPWWPVNGTAYLMAAFQQSLAVSSVYNRSFGVVSVDLSEWNTAYATPLTVRFVGYRSDGFTVTTSFVTDGIIDGAGPLVDFETFYFDARFDDLIRLEVPDYGWVLDNMVFFTVPEPGVGALTVLAAMVLLLRRSRGCR